MSEVDATVKQGQQMSFLPALLQNRRAPALMSVIEHAVSTKGKFAHLPPLDEFNDPSLVRSSVRHSHESEAKQVKEDAPLDFEELAVPLPAVTALSSLPARRRIDQLRSSCRLDQDQPLPSMMEWRSRRTDRQRSTQRRTTRSRCNRKETSNDRNPRRARSFPLRESSDRFDGSTELE